jgi:hypothetical protein
MQNGEIKKNTVVIDWQNNTMSFYYKDNTPPVIVTITKRKVERTSFFRILCALALQQDCYKKNLDLPVEDWISAFVWKAIVNQLNITLDVHSLNTYWSKLKNLNPEYVVGPSEGTTKDITKDWFVEDGYSHFFGEYEQLAGGNYKLWDIMFENATGQDFDDLKEAIVTAFEKLKTSGSLLKQKGAECVLAAAPGLGTIWELDRLIDGATDSIFCSGQNLYTIVRDIIEADSNNKPIEGYFRKRFEIWLKGSTDLKKRKIKLLFCDPRSEEAILHYALVFGEAGITHLFQAIPIFQKWQAEMGSIGFEAYVTSAVPMSLTAIDGDPQSDPGKGKMVIVPMAFEEKPGLRAVFFVTKKQNPAIFKHYYNTFNDRMILRETRPIAKVLPSELNKEKDLIGRYREIIKNLADYH